VDGMKVFVDSNVFIFANIKEYPEHDIAKRKLKDLMDKTCRILLNPIIVSEVHYKLYRLLNVEEAYERTLKIIFSGHIEYVPLGEDTVLKAIELSHSKKIRINDALIAQHALDLDADGLVTDNTKDFVKVEGLKVIGLREDE
jgi:predicted nucleic acid-binding protein